MDKAAPDYAAKYWQQVRSIDESEGYIRSGNSYFKIGRYEEAAQAYTKAYSVGDRAVSGFKLAETYERLGKYDEAIALLDQMVQRRQLSELGIQDANSYKAKLLAVKAASNK